MPHHYSMTQSAGNSPRSFVFVNILKARQRHKRRLRSTPKPPPAKEKSLVMTGMNEVVLVEHLYPGEM
ncbi:hypothetical protein AAFF_G00065800 [Aldrovandia affinis]|uniref:Uncharacterized protein n=1 Tax=Aldrovandia affinis TaxID=143900 RepID=A0AAD7WYL4_9TELE|nr:hypothetical protein AAFF_G00065800 [Aldrovandia affinis]